MSKISIRDNMLVTFGCRAGVMDALGHISLPDGCAGEDELAKVGAETVDAYIREEPDFTSFDEYIEVALVRAFPKKG